MAVTLWISSLCRPDPGYGGWAYVRRLDGETGAAAIKGAAGGERRATGAKMSLSALTEALDGLSDLPPDTPVTLRFLDLQLAGQLVTVDGEYAAVEPEAWAAARAAVGTVAEAMGLPDAETAAAGIVDIVNENMLGGLRLVSVQQGYDPRDFALVAFGGAGPLHANALGRLTGAWPVIIPPSPGVLCALGDATTSARDECARTVLRRSSELGGPELAAILGELASLATERLTGQGITDTTVQYHVDVRYHGQGFEIPVVVDAAWLDGPGRDGAATALLEDIGRAFDAEHERLFSFVLDTDHEIVNARASVTGPRPHVLTQTLEAGDGDPAGALQTTAPVTVEGKRVEAGVYDRVKLRAGDRITGPAIVTEMDSTTLVLPGHTATVHPSGSLLIRPTED